jgi:integrase
VPLTDPAIRAAKPGETLWDSSLKGFGLRAGKQTKTFIVLIASGRRKRIGTWPLVSLATARAAAKTLLAEKQLGRLFPSHRAFDDAKRDYLADCRKKNRPGTLKEYQRLLALFPFGRQSIGGITAREIVRILNTLNDRPSEKHHAFTALRAMLVWCRRNHLIDRSPMENMASIAPGRPRERVLTEEELRAVYTTARAGESYFHRIVTLLILTGQRRGEIAKLQWDWIAGDRINMPGVAVKNSRDHTYPIGPEAQAIINACTRWNDHPYLFPAARKRKDTTTVFNGWSKPKAKFDQEVCSLSAENGQVPPLTVQPWTLHDLRRTYSSGMAALGVPQIVVEKLLNHVSGGTQSPISQIYNRYSYMGEMREAVTKWETYLAKLTANTR